MRPRSQRIFASVSVLGFAVICCLLVPASSKTLDLTLQGRLRFGNDHEPMLEVEAKSYRLVSGNKSVSSTLKDERLSDRVLKVIGALGEDGSFDVHEFFVVRGDNLYRVVYFCEVCNITTFSPGNCLCCQSPTVPVEISPNDPRIFHEEIKGSPPD
jgi:hypothetical protein